MRWAKFRFATKFALATYFVVCTGCAGGGRIKTGDNSTAENKTVAGGVSVDEIAAKIWATIKAEFQIMLSAAMTVNATAHAEFKNDMEATVKAQVAASIREESNTVGGNQVTGFSGKDIAISTGALGAVAVAVIVAMGYRRKLTITTKTSRAQTKAIEAISDQSQKATVKAAVAKEIVRDTPANKLIQAALVK